MPSVSLTKVALLTAILGISLLLFLSQTLEPQVIKISGIKGNMLEQGVRVRGNITSFKPYHNFAVFDLQDETGKISVVVYSLKENLSGNVEVTGKVKEYYGEIEIEASKIKK